MMTVSETTQVIDHVANKLQVPTKELMSTLPQLGVHDLSLTVISAVVLLLSILSMCYFYRCMAQAENEETHLAAEFRHMVSCADFFGASIFFLFSLPSTIFFLFSLPSTILWLYSPKAWAIDHLLDLFRSGN